jgi:hypothetical protein
MAVIATLPAPGRGRNISLDFFRGVANLAIFLDCIPRNVANWVTTKNYGSSDATDLFVSISGYTAAFVYARMMVERGLIFAVTRMFKRVRQLYVTHIILIVSYIAAVSYVATTYNVSDIVEEFNIVGLLVDPIETLRQDLMLNFKPLNLDILPLYIVLMALFPRVLWMMLREPDLTIFLSLVLYISARQFGWNLPAYPTGTWYFNPLCWQLLFMFGAWFALGGAKESRPVINSPIVLCCGIGYLLFSFAMTMAGRLPDFAAMLPRWLFDAFNPSDKTDLRALPKITESIVPQIQELCWVGFTRMGHALALRDDSSGPSARCTQAFSGDGACSERTEPPALCRDGSACTGTWRGELDVADQRAGTLDDLSWTCRHSRPCFCSVGTNP